MDPMSGYGPCICLVLLGAVYLALRAWNLKRSRLNGMAHDLSVGRCLKCGALHPEAISHPDPTAFWTEFQCPECGRARASHLH